jgi:hypothetical protein
MRGVTTDVPDAYLGVLAVEEECKVYGFVTNTRTKLIVVVDDPLIKDDEMRAVSGSLASSAVCLLCSAHPFAGCAL